MAVKSVSIEEVGTHLIELFGWVEQGNEVVIVKNNEPRIKLVSIRR